MTTGRINQVTVVSRERREQLLSLVRGAPVRQLAIEAAWAFEIRRGKKNVPHWLCAAKLPQRRQAGGRLQAAPGWVGPRDAAPSFRWPAE